jgi:cytochrome d ubiquinol oxidase subunit I
MITAAYLTTAFTVAGIGAYYLWRQRHVQHARVMLGMAMIMAIFIAPLQGLFGDLHGLNTLKHQPAKVAAMESLWDTQRGAPLVLFGWPDQEAETTRYAIEIPGLSSLILTHDLDGEVKGLKEWPKDERPPVAVVFWAFRLMAGIGGLMIATGLIAIVLYLKKRLFDTRWFQYWCMALTPAGFIAVLAGWFVTEVGRQPWIVQGLMRTSDATSPVMGTSIAISLTAFVIIYIFVFGAGSYYILKLIGKGPEGEPQAYGDHGIEKPPIVTELPGIKEE